MNAKEAQMYAPRPCREATRINAATPGTAAAATVHALGRQPPATSEAANALCRVESRHIGWLGLLQCRLRRAAHGGICVIRRLAVGRLRRTLHPRLCVSVAQVKAGTQRV